jgi:hypothetical protein
VSPDDCYSMLDDPVVFALRSLVVVLAGAGGRPINGPTLSTSNDAILSCSLQQTPSIHFLIFDFTSCQIPILPWWDPHKFPSHPPESLHSVIIRINIRLYISSSSNAHKDESNKIKVRRNTHFIKLQIMPCYRFARTCNPPFII